LAKISAGGATETARITVKSKSGAQYLAVACSDGRILMRAASFTDNFKIHSRVKENPGRITRARLIALMGKDGYTLASP
jgi:hypothetical protein